MKKNILSSILRTSQTVFSFKELLLREKIEADALKSQLHYYVKNGDLYHIRRGIYAKDKNYNRFELATKIFTPSYISFETVLSAAGIIFQYYSQLFIASYQSRIVICDGNKYVFRALKPFLLTNSQGVEIGATYSIASAERAFLDTVYRYKNYHFDNLEPLDWDTVYTILPIYGDNKNMKKRIELYYKSIKKHSFIGK